MTEIVAHDVQFLAGGQGRGRPDEPAPPPGEADSDMPF